MAVTSRYSAPEPVGVAWATSSPEKTRVVDDLACPSSLARFFASQRHLPSGEDRAQATLADHVESVSRALHQSSQRHKPCAQQLMEGLPQADRQETLVWLVQAFDVMGFSDSLLFETALVLDRYYAALPKEDLKIGESQRKLLAAVCISLKTCSAADAPPLPLRQVVARLGHDQVPFDDVMVAELSMLKKLRFDVSTPTARDFLEALSVRLHRPSDSCRNLAEFLLQLSFHDLHLHYRYPHAVLAASALILALATTRAPAATHTVLLEDLVLHCPEAIAGGQNSMMAQCTAELHGLWLRAHSNTEGNQYVHHVRVKFARPTYQAVSSIQPPTIAPAVMPSSQRTGASQVPAPTVSPGVYPLSSQEDIDDAIRAVQMSLMSDFGAHSAGDHLEMAPHQEASSGSLRDAQQWSSALAVRLRGFSESSWKVHAVLARHGWSQNRFRRPPDREQLLRDLLRASKGVLRPSVAWPVTSTTVASERTALAPSGRHEREQPAQAARFSSEAPGCAQRAATGEQRRPRASSWCGQRSSNRTSSCLLTRSP
mmetsp:Transcript_102495/g.182095  ORF Transcript_102495/g.182095 Transcript_102495/m.182095 type:complete len:542 (-) Transcript_102495:158-1783(-)